VWDIYLANANSSQTCQSKDWKAAHSLECPIFSKLQPKVLPNNARAILRIILRHRKGKIEPQQLEGFLRLETHARDIRETNQEQWNRILLSAKAVKEYSGVDMDEEYISSFFAKVSLSRFPIVVWPSTINIFGFPAGGQFIQSHHSVL
jgi:SET and MYND domain-containing protein